MKSKTTKNDLPQVSLTDLGELTALFAPYLAVGAGVMVLPRDLCEAKPRRWLFIALAESKEHVWIAAVPRPARKRKADAKPARPTPKA